MLLFRVCSRPQDTYFTRTITANHKQHHKQQQQQLDEDKDGSISTQGAIQLLNYISDRGSDAEKQHSSSSGTDADDDADSSDEEGDDDANKDANKHGDASAQAAVAAAAQMMCSSSGGESSGCSSCASSSSNSEDEEEDVRSMLVVPHGEYSHVHVLRRRHHQGNLQSEEEQTNAKLESLMKSTLAYMSETLHSPERREVFERWLFKLADVHGTGRVGVQELEMLLKGLEFDGITCEDLTSGVVGPSGDSGGSSEADEAQRILDEYDSTHSGYLSADEFPQLAHSVMLTYQLHSADLHSRLIGGYQLTRKLSQGTGAMVRLGAR